MSAIDPAPGQREHPALALVNSHHLGPAGAVDHLADGDAARAWLDGHGLPAVDRLSAADLDALRELRVVVRELLLARIERRTPDGDALDIVNAAAAQAPTAPRLVWTGEREAPRAERRSLAADGPALVRALVAGDAIELVGGPRHTDLLACGATGCVRLLLRDHPRRQWCSTRCGDRVRASRYYHRHRGRPAPGL